MNMMDERGAYSAACVRKRFGSWGEALQSIGLTPNKRYDVTQAEVREDIRDVAATLNRTPTSPEYRDIGEFTVTRAQKLFGSWNKALLDAGFEPHHEIKISKQILLEDIHKLVESLDKVPTAADMNEYGRFSHRCYFDRWEGWQAAVRAAGYEPVGRPSGPDNGNWKANSRDESKYYGPNWKEQRAKALERDNYICQTPGCEWSQNAHCEEYGKDLNVHHIKPLCSFEDKSGDMDFEQANRLGNLVTVCVQHHPLWERVSPLRLDTDWSP